jgi:prepilin-type N-terminal cleavage/methylation domain-containing protein/prepilin-type processing-associated H-X9-DG protein
MTHRASAVSRGAPRRAFTLVELLVVIGIIAVLIGLLMPALSRAREQSNQVRCASQLQQIYHAQMFYADDNGGRVTPVMHLNPEDKWPEKLKKYVTRTDTAPRTLFHCPSLDMENYPEESISYGMNSAVMLPQWRMRRDRKCNSSEIILMGDKAVSRDDFLTTDNGWFLDHVEENSGLWIVSIQHESRGSYRHVGRNRANMLMLDGHVTHLGRQELAKESRHWFMGDDENIPKEQRDLGTCCPW